MVSKKSLELLGRLKQAAQRKKKSKVSGDQEMLTSDLVGDTSINPASTAPEIRGALLALAFSSQSSSEASAEGRQARLQRLKIKKATEGGTESDEQAALVSYSSF